MCRVSIVYERMGGFTAQRGTLPAGDAGTRKTLSLMRKLVLDGSRELEVREAAIDALSRAGARPHHPLAELDALFQFVRDRVRFTGDIVGVETLQGPRYTLHVMAGDCDDRAVLLAAMARSIGIPADLSFRVVAANPRSPRRFSHVYVIARIGGRSIALDPTYQNNRMGTEYAPTTRIGDFPL